MNVRTKLAAAALAVGALVVPALGATAPAQAVAVPSANLVYSEVGFTTPAGATTFTRVIQGQTVEGVVSVVNLHPSLPRTFSLYRPNTTTAYDVITLAPQGGVGSFRPMPSKSFDPAQIASQAEVWTVTTGSTSPTDTARIVVL